MLASAYTPPCSRNGSSRTLKAGVSAVEAAVGVKHGRIAAVELQPLAMRDEHRDFRSVFALVEDLLRFVIGRLEIDLRRAEERALLRRDVVLEDRARIGERSEGVENEFVVIIAAETAGRAGAG
jgi:hypothetical protein